MSLHSLALTLFAAASAVGCRSPGPLVGARSPDWLLEPVAPFSGVGESVLESGNDSPYGLVLGVAGGRSVVLLDRRVEDGGQALFVVEAVLELPPGSSPASFSWTCQADGTPATRTVAVVPDGKGCAPPGQAPTAAWRVEPEAKRFRPVDPASALRCLPMGCADSPDPVLRQASDAAPAGDR